MQDSKRLDLLVELGLKVRPGKFLEMPGRLWVGLQVPVPTENQSFSGKSGKLQEVGKIFGDIGAVSGNPKTSGTGRNFANRSGF